MKRQDATLWFPSVYLRPEDLNEKDVTLTICDARTERIRHTKGEDECHVLYFKETRDKARKTGRQEKRLIVRKTTWKVLVAMLGKWTDEWDGKRITLFTEPAYNPQTKKVGPALRIRDTLPPPLTDKEAEPDLEASDELEIEPDEPEHAAAAVQES